METKNRTLAGGISAVIRQIDPDAKVFLFGSGARGVENPDSEWDIRFSQLYSDLFDRRQKGNYSDFFELTEEDVMQKIAPTEELIVAIKKYHYGNSCPENETDQDDQEGNLRKESLNTSLIVNLLRN